MISTLITIGLIILAFWAVARFYLSGEDLRRFDGGGLPAIGSGADGQREPSSEHHEAIALLASMGEQSAGSGGRLQQMREGMDAMGEGADLTGITIKPVDVSGVPGEWVLAENADPNRRLLYLHGGAFTAGSPKSHRPITTKYARMAGVSVLAVDYRLVPENKRIDCLTDCQTAYRWILENGPDGPGGLDVLFVSGDSAGGNLTLVVIAWARDVGLRAADGAIALSPATDAAFASPSLVSNIATDHMLGPMFGRITKLPKSVIAWFGWLSNRMHPCDPRISPLRGDLANLPPTLVHASEAEMLLDDARRYVNKATAAGSEATLETWHHMLHVWHIFEPSMPEAQEAFEHIHRFMQLVENGGQGSTAAGTASSG
jgi:acetyl esterase/lipase